ncbi:hypothetical protein SSX86_018800 [Deinandra increscens subsp. villosa]|uniref:Mediator-associated protein 2 n=1 Tax=Deinandra increscens subsp. villosa TaxID=3103831 RepID=A0AAP0GSG3_9ASTR
MAIVNHSGLLPVPEFQEDSRPSIIEPNTTDSTELWLIQWPKDQVPDFDGQQLSVDLSRDDGQLGSFEASSGKTYDVVSSGAQEPKATVFLSSAADSKILGKITRRVSFVHYLDPSEVPRDDAKKLKLLYESSFSKHSSFATPTKSTRPVPSSGRASTHSSGRKSTLSEEKVQPKPSRSGQNSGHGSDHSEEKRSKKKKRHVA